MDSLIINNVWMMICTALVFFMHLGFAFLEIGLTRQKNTINILFKNIFIITVGLLLYSMVGFNLMYPGDFNGFIGFSGFGLSSPLTAIGSPTNMKLVFKGNNIAVGGSTSDLYPDGGETTGANAYFSYDLTSVLARVAQRPTVTAARTVGLYENTTTQIELATSASGDQSMDYRLIKQPSNGVVVIEGSVATYQPNNDYIGDDSFEYIMNDGVFDSSVAAVGLTVLQAVPETNTSSGSNDNKSGGGSVDWRLLFAMCLLLLGATRRNYLRRGS